MPFPPEVFSDRCRFQPESLTEMLPLLSSGPEKRINWTQAIQPRNPISRVPTFSFSPRMRPTHTNEGNKPLWHLCPFSLPTNQYSSEQRLHGHSREKIDSISLGRKRSHSESRLWTGNPSQTPGSSMVASGGTKPPTFGYRP